jgi:laminin alpha 1/2
MSDHFQLAFYGGRSLTVSRGQTQLNASHGLLVIPGEKEEMTRIGVESLFTTPLYWNVPKIFLGDRVLSYNGYLRFSTWSNGARPFSPNVLQVVQRNELFTEKCLLTSFTFQEYPLVQIQGNHRIVLEHFPRPSSSSSLTPSGSTGRHEVRLHESAWVVKSTRKPATREMIMIALQGVQQVLIRSSDTMEATQMKLEYVTLDVARPMEPGLSLRQAVGIEICDCPSEYKATSCQDPGIGFYRWYKQHYVTSEIVIDLVGSSKRCQCNGRADKCNPETGECQVRKTKNICNRKYILH